jgi:hypothetical protein
MATLYQVRDAHYLYCSDLHNGFARMKCTDFGHEYLLAFPAKCHCFHLVIFNVFLSSVLRTRRCSQCPVNFIFPLIT